MITCRFCQRECKNGNSLRNHERLCIKNPNRQVPTWLHGRHCGHPAWNKGLTKETNEKIRQQADNSRGRIKKPATEEYRRQQSLRLKQARLDGKDVGGLRQGAGRGKKGWYQGIWCDSSWELAFVIWHIDNKIPIRRNKEPFIYRFADEEHKYFPDFLVGNKDQLYEIKAYVDDKAKVKLASCSKPIILITYGQIEKYLEYAKRKVNCEDFTILYEGVNSAGCGGVSDKHV